MANLGSSNIYGNLRVVGDVNADSMIKFSDTTTKKGITGTIGRNDFWFVGGAATAANAGYLEISTGDDGQSAGAGGAEPIYVRQYGPGSPLTGTLVRTAALLDPYGNTTFPGALTVGTSVATNGSFSTGAEQHTFTTPSGNIQLGPMNGSFAHIYTDRPLFYFNKPIQVNGTTVSLDGHTHSAVAGLAVTSAATANTVAARDANGYLNCTYINSSRGYETSAAGGYIYDSGDGWMRKKTLANAQAEIVTNATVKTAMADGVYVPSGFWLYTSPTSGKYLQFGNYITGSQGTEMSIIPNASGGWCSIGSPGNPLFKGYSYGWVNSSDKNLKSEIVPFSKPEGYDMLKELKFYSYRYFKGSDEDKVARWSHSLGVLAQDAPYEITSYAEDGESEQAIDLYSYTSLLGIASQAMQDKIESLENQIEELKTTVADILAAIA